LLINVHIVSLFFYLQSQNKQKNVPCCSGSFSEPLSMSMGMIKNLEVTACVITNQPRFQGLLPFFLYFFI